MHTKINSSVLSLVGGLSLVFGLLLVSQVGHAYTQTELEIFNNEPPVIKDLLERASVLVADEHSQDATWKAANLYCEAARYGSAEGLYRLGMLYAFGRGVPANRDYAANLFGLAAMHGHFEAQKMLETIEIKTDDTPLCVLEAVAPERAPVSQYSDSQAIDDYVAKLPKNKRWVLDLVETISTWYKVDSRLVLSIITAESNFKTNAKSNADAHGLMQLIPATAERFNVKNAYNASQNIKGGVAYLRWLLSYFRGDVTLTVAAYNAGEGAVDKYKGVPPYKETRGYVKKVMGLYQTKRHDFDASITGASPALKKVSAQ
ncbi:MAG TPA: transglycosylase SLT domain-containing protein [Methylotenera sp.]|nr:transglycosylase SLT domain-containing protein [Methylotenera sp.]